MDSRSLILAALLSTLFVSLPDAINGIGAQTLINNACVRSSDPKTCVATLQQNPATSSATNAINLAEIALSAASDQSTTAVIFIGRLGPKHPISFVPLRLCANVFQNTKVLLLANDGDFKTGAATSRQNNALIMVGRCEAALKNDKIMISGLDDVITKWKTLFDAAHAATLAAQFDI